jgi:hypothetical protein
LLISHSSPIKQMPPAEKEEREIKLHLGDIPAFSN